MNLPDLASQGIYARLAWGAIAAVIAICVLNGTSRRAGWTLRPAVRRLIAALAAASMWLPNELSPAFWAGMLLQAPSVTLAALCVAWIWRCERPGTDARVPARRFDLWPAAPAVTTAAVGLLLYAGVFAWLPYDLYSPGFRPLAGTAVAAAVAVLWRALSPASGVAALCLGIAVLAHATMRWPTGNIWDAVLDPFLVAWSIATVMRIAIRSSLARHPNRNSDRKLT